MSRSPASIACCCLCGGLLLTGCGGVLNPFRNPGAPGPSTGEVAVPYGTQDHEDLTGAVTSVDADETRHLQDVLDMLRGHVAGLHVTELPGGEIQLRLRDGVPLLVIDDLPVSPESTRLALKGLIPREVASIQVLKDVSTTSVYGFKGANGVILIYMKR